MRSIASALIFIAIPVLADNIDDYIAAEMKREHIPGLALGIYRRGEILKAQGYGSANVELDVPVKPETIFQSGSVGKQFAATAIMMLVEEGKIDLEDSITKYFDHAPEAWKAVKVKNLLSHTSGIAEYESDARIKPGAPFYLRLDCLEPELFTKIAALPMDFKPGEKWRYTNTNYVLLGMMIRKVTGKFYGDFLAERIFHPLGMNATRIISERDIIPNRAAGYEWTKDGLKNQEWVSPSFNSTADGAIYFNVQDLAKWDGALYTESLVKQATLDRMWTVFPLNDGTPNSGHYGFAWAMGKQHGHKVIEHSGAWQGFTTYIGRYVDDSVTVVVLTNLDSGHAQPGKIGHTVAGLYNAELAAGAHHGTGKIVVAGGERLKAEEYSERQVDVDNWQVKLTTYKLGEVYHTKADNVSPGAALARTTGATREEAEGKALDRARQLLSRTRRHEV